MTGLERAREWAQYNGYGWLLATIDAHLKEDAERFQFAEDQYQRLQAELAGLREALEQILKNIPGQTAAEMRRIARNALKETP